MKIYISILIILASILLITSIYVCKKKDVPGKKPLLICILLVSIWSATYAFELLSYSLNMKSLWFIVRMAFILYIPALWLMTSLEITDRRNFNNKKNIILIILPTISAILIMTFQYNKLFMYNFYIENLNGFRILREEWGPWFWINAVYNYSLNIVNIAILFKTICSKQYARKKQAIIMLISMILPIISDILLVGKMGFDKVLDFTPLTFIIALIVSMVGIFKYGFMNIIPIARERIFEEMQELIIVLDNERRIVDINKKALKVFNLNISKVIGLYVDNVVPGFKDYSFNSSGAENVRISLNKQFKYNNKYYYVSVSSINGRQDELLGYLLLLQNITELKAIQKRINDLNIELLRVNRKLYNETIKDCLTGIYNKSHITKLLQDKINNKHIDKRYVVIALVDIDDFKKLNDTYGHLVGDEVLKRMVCEMKAIVGDSAKLGRFGGEEFLILIDLELQESIELCEKIRKSIKACTFESNSDISISVSIGVSELNKGEEINCFIKRTDDLLYKAKKNGKNRVEF